MSWNSDSSVFRVQQEGKQTVLEFLSKVFALSGAVWAVLLGVMFRYESIAICVRPKKKEKNNDDRSSIDMQMNEFMS
jgi:hypothetical protein